MSVASEGQVDKVSADLPAAVAGTIHLLVPEEEATTQGAALARPRLPVRMDFRVGGWLVLRLDYPMQLMVHCPTSPTAPQSPSTYRATSRPRPSTRSGRDLSR